MSGVGVTVAIIDDHDVVHAGIEEWCTHAEPPITIVGGFRNPLEFLARHPNIPHEIDVVLLDLQSTAAVRISTFCSDQPRLSIERTTLVGG